MHTFMCMRVCVSKPMDYRQGKEGTTDTNFSRSM